MVYIFIIYKYIFHSFNGVSKLFLSQSQDKRSSTGKTDFVNGEQKLVYMYFKTYLNYYSTKNIFLLKIK